jgi:hypothetical protein
MSPFIPEIIPQRVSDELVQREIKVDPEIVRLIIHLAAPGLLAANRETK